MVRQASGIKSLEEEGSGERGEGIGEIKENGDKNTLSVKGSQHSALYLYDVVCTVSITRDAGLVMVFQNWSLSGYPSQGT